jgi:hypothetical protein
MDESSDTELRELWRRESNASIDDKKEKYKLVVLAVESNDRMLQT